MNRNKSGFKVGDTVEVVNIQGKNGALYRHLGKKAIVRGHNTLDGRVGIEFLDNGMGHRFSQALDTGYKSDKSAGWFVELENIRLVKTQSLENK